MTPHDLIQMNMTMQIFQELGVSQRALAAGAELSKGAAYRLTKHGEWPATDPEAPARVATLLRRHCTTPQQLAALHQSFGQAGSFRAQLQAADAATTTAAPAAAPSARPVTAPPSEEDSMLLQHTALTPEARAHFNLVRNPFVDDISVRDDVFASPATRYARTALMDCALNHGFVALIGESGAGKTTLREELEQRIIDEQRPVVVIKPYTLAMEPDDVKGKRMKSGQIAEAIARTLAPSVTLKSDPDKRFAQVHAMLRDSCRAGSRHLLLIEEAHRMPVATMKHLKGWLELKDGMRRLLGVTLLGQPELAGLLNEQRADIREIVQRCEQVWLGPLDAQLEAYLRHKLGRVGTAASEVFDDNAYDAIRQRLIHMPRGGKAEDAISTCYPLAVANLVCRAMCAAQRAGWPKVDANVVLGC